MTRTNSDDPAFPLPPEGDDAIAGLTKHEYFAAMALQGLLASTPSEDITPGTCKIFAKDAVYFADLLIEALNQP